jgi:hypothetical protein|tara:strand:- start:2231 stop:2434 length:204 start_codon:yes stop_codon:yes gene_type:complete
MKAPDYDQKIKDLTLIGESVKKHPEQELMCHLLYSVRNYLRSKECTKDLRAMSVRQIISFSKKKVKI